MRIAHIKFNILEHYRYVTMVQKFWKQYRIKVKNYKNLFHKEWVKYFGMVFDTVIDIHIRDDALK